MSEGPANSSEKSGLHIVSCETCVGACCRVGTALQMTDKEAYANRREMNLKPLVKAKPYSQQVVVPVEGVDEAGQHVPVPTVINISSYHGFYALQEDCGHLTEDSRCAIYHEKQRPEACASYEVGSTACLGARASFGLDGNEAVLPLDTRTPIDMMLSKPLPRI